MGMAVIQGRMSQRAQQGFSLIELMIVVAIVAIIAAVGYPSYTDYVTRSHRQAGKNWLYAVADRQEQFFQDNKRYAPNLTSLGYAADFLIVGDDGQLSEGADPNRKYAINMTNLTATTYTVQAWPTLKQAERDTACQVLSLTHRGEQGQTGTGDNCW
jgi:type IV pilus assembly protein PilE